MGITWRGWRGALAVLALLAGLGNAAPGEEASSKAGEEALRKKALELNDITGMSPLTGKLVELTRDADETKKLLTVAHKMSKEKPQPFNRNVTFLLARAAENLKQVDVSAAFYRLNAAQAVKLVSERGLAQAYLGLIQMYQANRKFAESEKACLELLRIEGEEEGDLEEIRPTVMQQLVLAIARQGNTDRALKITDELLKANPRNWLSLALKAQVLRVADRLEESAKLYLEVIEKVKKDKRVPDKAKEEYIDDYRYLLSGVYTDLNQIDKASEQLKALLAREPNNPTYNNDLGYIWADRSMNLVEAEKLIRKAIDEDRKLRKAQPPSRPELDRDSSAYLDSLGWVLFKQGKAKEAKTYLLEAVKDREGQSTEIYDHLADVHLALGDRADAIAAWKKALEVATPSKRDQKRKAEVEKKLKKHEKTEE
jgi:tetratricopeptide (TPR) repeat protein